MTLMGRLILVRHGNTFDAGEVVRRAGARTDLPLSNSGRAQAGALAQALSGETFLAALASPLKRTRETARAILRTRTDAPALLIDSGLTEIDYGPDEGQPEEAVVARLGNDALAAWDARGEAPADWKVDRAAIEAHWRTLAARIAPLAGTVLIVTSNGIARFLPGALGLVADGLDLKLKTGAYCVIEITSERARIAQWNVRP